MTTSDNASRAMSVRFSRELQQQLLAASVATGLSVSHLLRQGAEMVVSRYLGDPSDIDEAVRIAEQRTARRVRTLLGSPARGASYEATREMLSFLVAELSRRIEALEQRSESTEELRAERVAVVSAQRSMDPSDPEAVSRVSDQYAPRATELRLVASSKG